MRIQCYGPRDAGVMIVGEFPTLEDERVGLPFQAWQGQSLTKMLKEAGIDIHQTHRTYVMRERPAGNDISIWVYKKVKKKLVNDEITWNGVTCRSFVIDHIRELEVEIFNVKPRVIIALGNTAIWALTGQVSADKWRGSQMRLRQDIIDNYKVNPVVIPTYPPATVNRVPAWRFVAVHDMRTAARVASYPETPAPATDTWDCKIAPTLDEVIDFYNRLWERLEAGPTELICDLEIKESRIICMGLAFEDLKAICIPFLSNTGFYWTPEEHTYVVECFRRIAMHPNCRFGNQNVAFDITFLWNDWGIWPVAAFDTMIAQAVLFPGTTASLDYLASLYCPYYLYWKDDGKFWKEFVEDHRLWRYNCYDCIYTWQVWQTQKAILAQLKLSNPARDQFRILTHVMAMMFRGVKVDLNHKNQLFRELIELVEGLKSELEFLVGYSLWAENGFSPKRIADFFYGEMKMPIILNPKTKTPTCDDEALKKFAQQAPWLRPICERINLIRSYGTAINVCLSRVDRDGQWRCSYRVAGTSTLRFKSSENPYGSGTNLQNITLGRDILGD